MRAALGWLVDEYAAGPRLAVAAGRAFHGIADLGRLKDAEYGHSALVLNVGAAAEMRLGHRVMICPVVSVTRTWGPYDVGLIDRDYAAAGYGLGLGGTLEGLTAGAVAVRPLVAVRAQHLTVEERQTLSLPFERSVNDWYGLVEGGAGFTWREAVTLRLSVRLPYGLEPPRNQGNNDSFGVPFGSEEGKPAFLVEVGVSFGPRRDAR